MKKGISDKTGGSGNPREIFHSSTTHRLTLARLTPIIQVPETKVVTPIPEIIPEEREKVQIPVETQVAIPEAIPEIPAMKETKVPVVIRVTKAVTPAVEQQVFSGLQHSEQSLLTMLTSMP